MAFMNFVRENCDINHLALEAYQRKLIMGIFRKSWRRSSRCPVILGSKVLKQAFARISGIGKQPVN